MNIDKADILYFVLRMSSKSGGTAPGAQHKKELLTYARLCLISVYLQYSSTSYTYYCTVSVEWLHVDSLLHSHNLKWVDKPPDDIRAA